MLPPKVQLISKQGRDLREREYIILEISLQASINARRLINIINLERLDKYRGRKSSSGVFKESFSTYRECVYPNGFHIYKHK